MSPIEKKKKKVLLKKRGENQSCNDKTVCPHE